jgi:hypothetical protein
MERECSRALACTGLVKRLTHKVQVRESTTHTTVNTSPKTRHPTMTRANNPGHVIPKVCSLRIEKEVSPRARCSAVVVSTSVPDRSAARDRQTAKTTTTQGTAKRARVTKAAFICVPLNERGQARRANGAQAATDAISRCRLHRLCYVGCGGSSS